MKKFKWLGGVIVFFVVAYVAVGPFLTIYNINQGMTRNDSEKLADNIEFSTLRHNMKDQFNMALAKKSADSAKDNPLAAIGSLFAKTFLDQLVDSLVTPKGLASILEGTILPATSSSTMSTTIPPSADGDPDAVNSPAQQKMDYFNNARYWYHSPNRFSVWVLNSRGEETQFVLHRDGLSWKLVNIVIPLSVLAENKINNTF